MITTSVLRTSALFQRSESDGSGTLIIKVSIDQSFSYRTHVLFLPALQYGPLAMQPECKPSWLIFFFFFQRV